MLSFPNAKINLGLYVLGTRPDGLHDIETIFLPIPLRDALEVTTMEEGSADYNLSLSGRPVEGNPDDNLVARVFRSLQQEFGLPPCSISLDKHIPTGAGLGGGSSDAAFMMKMLNQMFSLGLSDDDMRRRLAKFGADCPFFVANRPAFATGIGDVLTPLSEAEAPERSWPATLVGKHLVLVKPPVAVSTREAYADVPCRDEAPVRLPDVVARPISEWSGVMGNDFERSVYPRHPQIAAINRSLYDIGAAYAAMSGSGSTVFAIFDHQPATNLHKVFDGCFVFSSDIRPFRATFN